MPPFWTRMPFALFCLVEIPHEKIDNILREAYNGPVTYSFWLASEKYSDAPQKKENEVQEGTKPPISKSFPLDFVGKKVEDAAKWLQEKPDHVDLDAHHFAVLDRRAETDRTVVICRIGDRHLKGDELDYIRFKASEASLHLNGMEYGSWEEFGNDGLKNVTAEIEY